MGSVEASTCAAKNGNTVMAAEISRLLLESAMLAKKPKITNRMQTLTLMLQVGLRHQHQQDLADHKQDGLFVGLGLQTCISPPRMFSVESAGEPRLRFAEADVLGVRRGKKEN